MTFEVHLDMDGVLADFAKSIEQVSNVPIDSMSRDEVYEISDTEGFFRELEPMEGCTSLLGFLADHDVPTSINSSVGTRSPERVEKEKMEFLDTLLKGFQIEQYYFVTTSKDKGLYAHEKAILIDDRQKCIDAFTEAGGIAILHVNVESTISRLKEIMGL